MAPKPALEFGTLIFGPHFFDFFVFSSLGRVPEGSRTGSGGSGDPPGPDFGRVFRYFVDGFRRDLVVIRRVPPGYCRDTPPTSGT